MRSGLCNLLPGNQRRKKKNSGSQPNELRATNLYKHVPWVIPLNFQSHESFPFLFCEFILSGCQLLATKHHPDLFTVPERGLESSEDEFQPHYDKQYWFKAHEQKSHSRTCNLPLGSLLLIWLMSNCETEGSLCTLSVTCRFKIQGQRVGIGRVLHSGDFCRQSRTEGIIKPKFYTIQENFHKSIKVSQPLSSVPKPLLSPIQTFTNLALLRESYYCFLKKKKNIE